MKAIYHPLQEEDRGPLAVMREAAAPMKGEMKIEPDARVPFDSMMEQTPAAEGVTYEAGNVGGVWGYWCRPVGALKNAAVLYLHGGAYVIGSAQAYRHLVGQIATRAGVDAFVVEYRLAPEHPFPSAVKDAAAAYRGLAGLGFTEIALAGDSAGGGLALVTLAVVVAEAKNGAGLCPQGAAAMSPWTDLTLSGASMETRAEADPILTKGVLADAARLYLGSHDANDPLASPLAGDLAGLPPIRLHVGENEVLLDDTRRYADKADKSDSSEVHVWEGMPHVFPANLGTLAAAGIALDDIGDFLRQRLNVMNRHSITAQPISPLLPDDLTRKLTVARPNEDQQLPHIGVVGDTYTILLTGDDTDGRYCLIDMHIPPGGGPPPHRHDFEESFTLLEGEMEATFRGVKSVVRAGETVNIPANAPHQFHNASSQPVRLLCICAPSGQEEFFLAVGVPVAARTTAPPPLDTAGQAVFLEKAKALAPKYRTELLEHA